MSTPKRIMIIGNPGSGKSTGARMIGAALNVPVFHMDRDVFWLPGWQERDKADKLRQVQRIVAQDRWVIDGNNSSTFQLRADRADLLIWLDIPVWLRILRVIRRSISQRGQTRSDMAEGCVEDIRMLPAFLHFIVSTRRRSRRNQATFFAAARLRKQHFRSTRDFNRFVRTLGC